MSSLRCFLSDRCRSSARSLASLLLVLVPLAALADDAQQCATAHGTLLTGKVLSAPTYKKGMFRKGIELSHTHVNILGDDGNIYDIAIDNVFASGYRENADVVPPPLDSIAVGDRLEACGIPYAGGIHWVHTNCGDTPTTSDPNGWLKIIQPDGSTGASLEDSQTYCPLWSRN